MAHHLGVRRKHRDSNGAPSPGAPLLTFFYFFGFLVACNNLRFEIKEKENANGVIKPLCKDLELDDMVEIK